MEQKAGKRKVVSQLQMALALELRASGASYEQIGKALTPSVTKQRAYRIVLKALNGLLNKCSETADQVRQLHLLRLNRMRLSLEPKKGDPRVVTSLLQIMEREAKLLGLDAPQRIEASGPGGGPIETEEKPDYSKLTLDELLQLNELLRKAHGLPEGCIDEGPYTRKWYAAQRVAEARPALAAGS